MSNLFHLQWPVDRPEAYVRFLHDFTYDESNLVGVGLNATTHPEIFTIGRTRCYYAPPHVHVAHDHISSRGLPHLLLAHALAACQTKSQQNCNTPNARSTYLLVAYCFLADLFSFSSLGAPLEIRNR
jgi:hypothetical protein